MYFTFDAYRNLLRSLKDHGYTFCSYDNWINAGRCVILRHDIDNDIGKALDLARIEREEGVASTFFVLVTADFYNVFSAESSRMLQELASYGHEIGLHFDEIRYPEIITPEDASEKIQKEAMLLGLASGSEIKTVSMHRPSKMILEADLVIPGMVNSYGKTFFKGFKYVSDSRRRWREPVEEIIASEQFERLHILTHAIWYHREEMNLHDAIEEFVNGGNRARYRSEMQNITDLSAIMAEEEIR